MIKKHSFFLFFLLTCLLSTTGFGQRIWIDKVELKDGSTLIGKIIDIEAGKQLVLKLQSDSLVHIDYTDVEQIRQDRVRVKQYEKLAEKKYEFKEAGVFFSLEGGGVFGNPGYRANNSGGFYFNARAGHQFNRLFGLGFETGIHSLVTYTGEQFIPLAAYVRGFVFEKKVTPYYSLSAGYGLALNGENSFYYSDKTGGIYVQPAVGLRLAGSSGSNAYLHVGLTFQKAKYVSPSSWFINPSDNSEEENITYQRWRIGTGIMF